MPMTMCPRCACCSIMDERCAGSCLPCGHHTECIDCEDKDEKIKELTALLEEVIEGARRLGIS